MNTIRHYLDPKGDLPFKRIFGEHPDLLKSFLNALMPFEEGQHIVSLEYLAAEQVPNNPAKKNSIVDVKCKDNYGRQFIVEMQVCWNDVFPKRMLFNASKTYVKQLDSGDNYHELQPVYALGIINATFDHQTEQFYHHFKILNRENSREVIEGLEFILVELPKFRPADMAEKRMAVLWLRFLKEVTEKVNSVSEELLENEEISRAVELCKVGAFTDAELEAYDNFWDIVRTENAIIASNNAKLAAKDAELAAKDAELERERAEKEAALKREEAKDAALAAKDAALERERAEKEALLAEIAALKNGNR
jgi:predicted transposase/invertase (TIGR01784 family)